MIQKGLTSTIYFIAVLIICSNSACKKDDELMSAVPEIEFVSVTPTSLKEYSAPLSFTIKYRDGDGNLGENNADVKNLYLTDNRINVTYTYRIQQLAPDNSSVQEGDGLADAVTEMYRINSPQGYANLREIPDGMILREVYPYEFFTILGELNGFYGVELQDGTKGFIQTTLVVPAN
jgi:hypothetical protein